MSDKTPLQEMLSFVEKTQDKHKDNDFVWGQLQYVVAKLTELLPNEKQFVQDAFIKGSKIGFNAGSSAHMSISPKTTSLEYFATYYKKYEL